MLNQVILVGRLVEKIEIKEVEKGKKVANITLAVPRSYKNAEGVYETDFVECVLWEAIAQNASEYCQKGDLIGVKGRIETSTYEDKNGEKRKNTKIMVEKLTFLSSKKSEE